jgi:hypothetical protein
MMRCRRPLVPALVAAVAVFSLLAAGCGSGGGSPRVASVASTTSPAKTAQTGALAYSACMRSHGLPNFPDPDSQGNFPSLPALGVSKQTWAPADIACKHLLPNGGSGPQETAQQERTRVADGLSFARCIRSHGVTRFPDPTTQGQLTGEMVQAQGIDVHSPAVLQAVQACLPASHGALTPAKVRAALNSAGG